MIGVGNIVGSILNGKRKFEESLEGIIYKSKLAGVSLFSALQIVAPPLALSNPVPPPPGEDEIKTLYIDVEDSNFLTGIAGWEVDLLDKETGDVIGTGVTNDTGFVAINYDDLVGVGDYFSIPTSYAVSNQYPQPTTGITNQDVQTPVPATIYSILYDELGQEVSRTEALHVMPGVSTVTFSEDLATAVYYQRTVIEGDNEKKIVFDQKVLVLKDSYRTFSDTKISPNTKTEIRGNQIYKEVQAEQQQRMQKITNGRDSIDVRINANGYEQYLMRQSTQDSTHDARINQIPTSDAIDVDLHVNRTPTNTNGSNLNIDEQDDYFSGVTNSAGNFSQANVGIEYIFNPQNANDKIYIPEEFVVQVFGPNVTTTSENFAVDGQDMNETIDVAQTQIPKTNSLEIFVNDDQTLQGIENAFVEVFDESVSLGTGTTGPNGIETFAINYQGYEGDPNGVFNNIGEITIVADATDYDQNQINADFRQTMNETVSLNYNPQTTTVDFTIHWFDVNGNAATNGDFQIKWENGGTLKTYTNDGTGKIVVSEELSNVAPTDSAEINHTNLTDYLHWDIARTYEPNQYDKEPIFQNVDWNTNAYFNIQTIDGLNDIYIFAIPRTVSYSGGTLQTDQAPYIDMLNIDPGFVIHSKSYPGIPNQRWVQLEENLTTGDPVPLDQLNRALEKFQYVFEACTLSNGVITQVNEPIQRLSINSPEWQQYVNEELKNVHYTYFANEPPGFSVVWTVTPDLRIHRSSSTYGTDQPDGVILEETLSQIANIDADADYVATPTLELTETMLTALRTNKLMATWTQYYPTSNKPEKKEFEENTLYTTTSTLNSEGQKIVYTVMEKNNN